ncbi:MAG: 16S rRNA (uracil(1498)-N(3))-methyltransferase [Deltaproteobacteria bacterium]|nr:16S rRNA (uracil(1498)-N(3))-methyltransferase [Deltaproteobacteria bacterium]
MRSPPPAHDPGPTRRPPRLFVELLCQGTVTLSTGQAHYLTHVLRLGQGAPLVLFDAAGGEADAVLLRARGATLEVEVEAAVTRARGWDLTVALAVPKGERADWAVEKLTEVGVARILWLLSERSVVKPERFGARQARLQRIAAAAASQSGRVGLPEIVGPMRFEEFLTLSAEHRLIADMSGEPMQSWLSTPSPRVVLLGIGPEGGFAAVELEAAERAAFHRCRLGANTLRIETAAVVGAAMILGQTGRPA